MSEIKIRSIRKLDTKHTVYDFTVEDNHHYILENGIVSHNSYVPTKEVSGGGGLKYAASTILMLSKSKDKDSANDQTGVRIKVTAHKSRFIRENTKVETVLHFDSGLDRYGGLFELGEEAGIFQKDGTRFVLPDGTKVFGKYIRENPEKVFTPEILQKLDEWVQANFKFGTSGVGDLLPEAEADLEQGDDNDAV